MLDSEAEYKVIKATPRKGEVYAVTLRNTGITVLRKADRDFRRDVRRVIVPATR